MIAACVLVLSSSCDSGGACSIPFSSQHLLGILNVVYALENMYTHMY